MLTTTIHYILLIFLVFFTFSKQESLLDGVVKLVEDGEDQISNEPEDMPGTRLQAKYDFIVVGAGTAGCVVANRLSENPNWTVLLIEAGRPENFLMDMPILANYLQFTEANWAYKTEPSDKYCMGMDNHQCNWPRGKVVGGSSVLNYMIYTRGNRRDYDRWAQLGNTGWSFRDILPYYKKIENFTAADPVDWNYHNNDGYLHISKIPYETKIVEAFVQGAMHHGFNYVDYDGATQIGVSKLHVSMNDGVRDSSSRAYLHPVRSRSNLHMKKYSLVSKVLIDPKTKTAYGVEFINKRRKYTIYAKKEVILSAGAINSPQLLMLSGIGPKKHLTSLGIPVISNLRVGFNLMDHVSVGGLTFIIDEPYSLRTQELINNKDMNSYLNHHQGPLTIPGGCEALVFYDSSRPNDPDGWADLELLFEGGSIVSDATLYKNFGITQQIYNKVFKPIEKKHTFMILPMLMRPKTRGRIMLRSANYKDKPLIFPNYYSEKEDIETMIRGIRLALNVTSTPPMKAIGTRLHTIPIPGCAHNEFGSDAYFECMARHFTFTIYHQSGTCKMGPPKDKKAVVDPRLKVYGVNRLRVIDASIIPEIPSAHTNAPVYMIAEKGVDLIKQDWGVPISTKL